MNRIKTQTVMSSLVIAGTLMTVSLMAEDTAKSCCGAAAKGEVSKQAPAAAVKLQTKCPVMGGAINKSMYVDHGGKRIYMCCMGCEGALKKDPAKYIKKLEAEGITLDIVPVKDKSKKKK